VICLQQAGHSIALQNQQQQQHRTSSSTARQAVDQSLIFTDLCKQVWVRFGGGAAL
jgi:hypothetical protein